MDSASFHEDVNEEFNFNDQLLNHVVDYKAQISPNLTWAEIPKSELTYDDGYCRITYKDFANGVNDIANWLQAHFGRDQVLKPVAYLGPWDVRYVIMILGAVKAGFKMMFPPPRYSTKDLARWLDEVNCKIIIIGGDCLPTVRELIAIRDMTLKHCPTVSAILNEDHNAFRYNKSFATAKDDPLVVLGTSGTTGNPKAILWTQAFVAVFLRQCQLIPPAGHQNLDETYKGKRLMSMMPVFHCGNLFTSLLSSVLTHTIAVYPLASSKLDSETLLTVLKHVEVDMVVVPPFVAEAIAANPKSLDFLAEKTTTLAYAGGPVSRSAGEKLTQRVQFFCVYACTENGIFSTLRPDGAWIPGRWNRIHLNPEAGVEFRHVSNNDFEAVVECHPDPAKLQPVFGTFPDLEEWRSKDLFSPDPADPRSWGLLWSD
ncbi:hypothetical protein MMC25_004200 [Agyrium rufum]|nr:hypothetical protein [Agyrium rufum]